MAGELLKLHRYQEAAALELYERQAVAAIMPMGAGKTLTTLATIYALIKSDHVDRVVVFAPKTVAVATWTDEVELLGRPLKVVSIAGKTPAQRKKLVADSWQVLVCNYEIAGWLEKELTLGPRDMVVFDELTRVKSHKSTRRKSIQRMAAKTRERKGLTGSPKPNSALDLWGMADALRPGIWGPFTRWRATHFRPVDRDGHIWQIRAGHDELVDAEFAELCFAIDPSEIPASPIAQQVLHPFSLPKKLMAQYKELEEELVWDFESDEPIVASNAMSLSMKLRQLAAGFIMDGDDDLREVHELKLDMTSELVEQSNSPCLIIYSFRHEIEMLRRRFPKAINLTGHKDVKGVVDAWNRGEIEHLFGHPQSMGHGLNMQKGPAQQIIWHGPTWSFEEYEQTNARLARQGQTRQIYAHVPVVRNSKEMDMLRAWDRKSKEQQALKEKIKKV